MTEKPQSVYSRLDLITHIANSFDSIHTDAVKSFLVKADIGEIYFSLSKENGRVKVFKITVEEK